MKKTERRETEIEKETEIDSETGEPERVVDADRERARQIERETLRLREENRGNLRV